MMFEKKAAGRELVGYLLLAVSVLLLCRSAALCFSNDIWYDELFTVGMVEHSYGDLIAFTARDVHPPLYYCIVKLLVDLCKLIMPGAGTVIPAKLVSVLPYFILFLYSVTLIRRRWGIFSGGLFLFCVTAMPQLAAYTVEVRMYGWALLFVTAAFLHAYGCLTAEAATQGNTSAEGFSQQKSAAEKVRRRTLHGAAFVLYSLAAAYTQYFAAVAIGMVYLYLLLAFLWRDRGRLREWFCYAAAVAVGYVPWLFALFGQLNAVGENYWILPLTWRSLGGCVKFLLKPAFTNEILAAALAVVLLIGYVAVFVFCGLHEKHGHNGRVSDKTLEDSRFLFAAAGVGVLAGLVAFGFAASLLFRPVFVYRYMIPALGCFWLAFAVCLDAALSGHSNMLCKQKKLSHKLMKELCKSKKSQCEEEKNAGQMKKPLAKMDKTVRAAGIMLTIVVIIVGLRDYRAFMGEEEYKAVCMRETEGALSQIGAADTVLYNFDQVQAVTGYYLPESTKRLLWRIEGEQLIQEITSPCGYVEEVEEIRRLAEIAQAGSEKTNLWFIGSFNSRDEIVEEWQGAGLTVEEMGSFLLERYWFNLYKISFSDHTA